MLTKQNNNLSNSIRYNVCENKELILSVMK